MFTQLSSVAEAAYRNTQDGQPSPPTGHLPEKDGSTRSLLARNAAPSRGSVPFHEGDGHVTSLAQNLSVATANVSTLRPRQLKQVLGRSIGAGVSTRAAELDEVFTRCSARVSNPRGWDRARFSLHHVQNRCRRSWARRHADMGPSQSREICHAICSAGSSLSSLSDSTTAGNSHMAGKIAGKCNRNWSRITFRMTSTLTTRPNCQQKPFSREVWVPPIAESHHK